MVITSSGDGDAGSIIRKNGVVCSKEAEYSRVIYCDANNYGPLQGDGVDARDMGSKRLMRTVGNEPIRSKGSRGGGSIRVEVRVRDGEIVYIGAGN